MYVHMYICAGCHVHNCRLSMHDVQCVGVHGPLYESVVYSHMYVCKCTYVCMYVYLFYCAHVEISVYVCVHVYVHMHSFVYTYRQRGAERKQEK